MSLTLITILLTRKFCRNLKSNFKTRLVASRQNCEICVKSVTVFAGLLKTSLLGRIAWHGCKMNRKLALLSQAKDNLANSYVGRVERGFENYANTLMGNQLGDVMVDKDLHLYIDEKGAAREVGSFSAGTIDCIMLCMRLSLVDALFGDEKPFLILDDPFVNLDDEHTKRALEMLDKIAQDHQVVYLVCNTSRK